MRKVLIGIVVLFLVVSGGVIGFFLRQEQPREQVLGESVTSPFWQNTVLFVSENGELFSWDKEHSPQPIGVLARKRAVTAAVTPDQRQAVIVLSENETSTFWLYSADRQARPLASVQGNVSQLSFSESGKLLLFVQQRKYAQAPELDLLSLADEKIQRVANNAVSGIWLADPAAVLSRLSDGQLWYHQFIANGSLDSVSIPVLAASNPVAANESGDIIFVKKSDEGMSLVRFSLSTKERQLIVPLPGISADARDIRLQLSSSENEAMIVWAAQNGTQQTSLVRIDAGIVETLPVAAQKLASLDDQSVVIERTETDGGGIAILRLDSAQYQNIPETQKLHLLP